MVLRTLTNKDLEHIRQIKASKLNTRLMVSRAVVASTPTGRHVPMAMGERLAVYKGSPDVGCIYLRVLRTGKFVMALDVDLLDLDIEP